MLRLSIIAAIVACANAYYNHGHQGYYGNYGGHVIGGSAISSAIPAASVIPVDGHHGSLYNHGYGSYGSSLSHAKVIEATYPGAVHKSVGYGLSHPAGYYGTGYAHGSSIPYAHSTPVISGGHTAVAYNHPSTAVAPAYTYNHASIGNYAHSRYAVTEGPNYAHSRYSITHHPALSYGHSRYPVAVGHSAQKISYSPVVSSHMGYQGDAAHSYAW